MDEQKWKLLQETGHYLSVPSGVSMYPMLKNKENVVDIVPVQGRLNKYDVALYYRPTDNKCVLHRVLRVVEDHYIFYGDNCHAAEYVEEEQIIGVADRFYRGGKWVSVRNLWYLLYVHLWCDLLPVRVFVFRVRDKLRKVLCKRAKKER